MRTYRSVTWDKKLHVPQEVSRQLMFRVPLSLYEQIKERAIREKKSQTLLVNELLQCGLKSEGT